MMDSPFSLKGKTILITGASSGIGEATAIECSKAGASLILTGRNVERLQKVQSVLVNQNNFPFIVADMKKEEDIKRLVSECPILDGVFINAGISNHIPIKFIKSEIIEEIFKVNVFAPILITRELLKQKKIRTGGSIVFTSSVSGNNTVTTAHELYSATKSSITGFMKNAALDLAPVGTRVNAINPGMIETPLIQKGILTEEEKNEDMKLYPMKRYGRPEEVAYAAIYLFSDATKWMTGHSLIIDGGLTLR